MENLKKYFDTYAGYVFWAFFTLVAAGVLFVLSLFVNEVRSSRFIGENIEFRNTISVSGEGEVFAAPDTAQFSFAVIEEADTVSVAQGVVTKKMNTILDMLKKDMDVPEKNIKTTNYNIAPRYEYEDTRIQGGFPVPGERTLVGYEVSHWVEVKMKNDDTTGAALARVGELGATNVSSINFVIEDEEKVLREARKKAIEDAKEKAKILADDLDVRIIKIVSFNEGGGPVYYARDFALSEAAFGKGGAEPPQIPTGENKITSFVTITYAIK